MDNKDKLIVRQVAIKSAIEMASSGVAPYLVEVNDVFKFAQDIEDWVLNPFTQSTNSVVSTPATQPSQPNVSSQSPVGQTELKCPACASKVYDNRFDKKSDKSPNFKCGNKQCTGGNNGFPFASWSDEPPLECLPNFQEASVPVAKSIDELEDNVSPF
jgi:hypothetical protein